MPKESEKKDDVKSRRTRTNKKPKHGLKGKHELKPKHELKKETKKQQNKGAIKKQKEEINKKVENDVELEKENTELVVSEEKGTELSKFTKQLETIQKEIKEETSLPKEKANKLDLCVFKNIMFAIIWLVYFVTIDVLSVYLKPVNLLMILKVSSVVTIILTIIAFEYAYRKDSGKDTIYGIELLVISILILFARYIYIMFTYKYVSYVIAIGLICSVYYIGKAIVEYILKRKELKREVINDNNEMRSK